MNLERLKDGLFFMEQLEDNRNWHCGFYANKRDVRVFVACPYGITLNFAHRSAWGIIMAFIAAICILSFFLAMELEIGIAIIVSHLIGLLGFIVVMLVGAWVDSRRLHEKPCKNDNFRTETFDGRKQ